MKTPKTLTPDQCQALIEELVVVQGTSKQKARGFRNSAMAVLMLETGVRVGELCKLRISDLWFVEQPVDYLVVRKVIAKNNEERQIPISVRLRDTILSMSSIIWSADYVLPSHYAFFSKSSLTRLSTRSVERIILAAGIAAFHLEVTPHWLRHTFGSNMMRKTNARVVQALLGHSSLQSTQIYMHPNSEDLRKAIDS